MVPREFRLVPPHCCLWPAFIARPPSRAGLCRPSESDDLWIIEYAVQRSGWVCSNDLFRDHLSDRARRFGPGEAATLSAFIDEHVIPYAWRSATEFLPQPVKARAALLAPRPPTPDVVHAAALLPPGVTEALAAARRPPMPHDAAPVSRVPLPLLVTPSVGAWDDGDADMLPVDAPAQALAAVSSEASRCATEQAPFSRAEDLPAHLSRVVAAVFGSTRDTRVALTPVPAVLPSPSTLAAVIGACAEVYDRAWVAVTEAGYTAETRAAAAEKLAAAVLVSFVAEVAAAAKLAGLTRVPPQPTPLWSAAREALLLSVSRARQPWHATAPG